MRKRRFSITRIAVLFMVVVVAVVSLHNFIGFRRKQQNAWKNRYPSVQLNQIRAAEIAYSVEWKVYVANQPSVTPPLGAGQERRNWLAQTRFSIIGYALFDEWATLNPEYNCSFAIEGSDYPSMTEGFVARAVCDQNANGKPEIYVITNESNEVVRSGDIIR